MRLKISAIALPLAILLLGLAIQVRNGLYNPIAISLLTAAAVACGFAVFSGGISELRDRALLEVMLKFAVLVQLVTILTTGEQSLAIKLLIAIGVAAAMLMSFASRGYEKVFSSIVLVMFGLGGIFTIKNSPQPFIDTFVQNRDSVDALLHGINPYTITFPDIYEGQSFTYPPGMVRDGRVMLGYPYVPLPAVLQLPSYALTGDPRFAQLVALLLAGGFLIAIDLKFGALAATLLLFSPRAFYVLDMSWVDSFMIMFLAATVWCALRERRLLPIALGLFIAGKQHVFLCLPLTFLLMGNWRDAFKLMLKSLIIAGIVSLPIALWNWRAFYDNTIGLQLHLPFRDDSLSYPAWIAQLGGPHLPSIIGFIAMAMAMGVCLKMLRPSVGNFALAVAFSFFALFAFNKQAFCNYYFFVIGGMCCAVAVTKDMPAEADTPTEDQGLVVG